jgi:hypothetical protein
MDQKYRVIFLAEKQNGSEIIRSWLDTKSSQSCYLNDDFLHFIEYMLSSEGMFYRSRIVWTGNYDESKDVSIEVPNLYNLCKGDGKALQYIYLPLMQTRQLVRHMYNIKKLHYFLVNHTKKQFVNMRKDKDTQNRSIHPLPLLVSEGNGQNHELCGTWARDIISVDEEVPADYTELVCDL